MEKKTTPRGIRNNNPLNIKNGEQDLFVGEIRPSKDKTFRQFRTMAYGYRAAMRIIRTYVIRHGLMTVEQVLTRWAPATENDTANYIDVVTQRSGLARNYRLQLERAEMVALVSAMCYMENGVEADEADVRAGFDLLMG